MATFMPLANGTVLVPRATLAWQYAFGDVTPTAGLAFQGTGTAFTVAGVPIARNSALVEGGFDWRFSPAAKLGVSLSGRTCRERAEPRHQGRLHLGFLRSVLPYKLSCPGFCADEMHRLSFVMPGLLRG